MKQFLLELGRASKARRQQQKSRAEGDVRPRVTRADRAHLRPGGLRFKHYLDYVLQTRWGDDAQRVDALVARVVAPAAPQAERQPWHDAVPCAAGRSPIGIAAPPGSVMRRI